MYCGGGHLGFPIDIKNINFVEDLPMIIPGQFGHEYSLDGPLQTLRFLFRYGIQMAATAGLSLTLDPMGKMFQNASSLSEKKAFEHFPIGSNVNLCIAVAAILDFRSTYKT
jgi:hypothetical protein